MERDCGLCARTRAARRISLGRLVTLLEREAGKQMCSGKSRTRPLQNVAPYRTQRSASSRENFSTSRVEELLRIRKCCRSAREDRHSRCVLLYPADKFQRRRQIFHHGARQENEIRSEPFHQIAKLIN